MKKDKTSQSGVALLMSLGILAILSILSVAFSTNMRLMERTSRDFIYEMQARYLAQGGIEYAIAELKEDARNSFTYDGIGVNDELNPADIDFPQDITGKLEVSVIDTARQININAANENLLACLPGIGTRIASNITSKRSEISPNTFLTKQSITLADRIGEGTFNEIKDFITVSTYKDPNVQDDEGTFQERSAININTVAIPILRNILDVVSGVSPSNAATVAEALSNSGLIRSWTEFNAVIDNAAISSTAKNNIKSVFNPNRVKPDDNFPTEFCFHSGGTYEITSTAAVSKGTQTLASKTITGTIKIFDLWNQTKAEQFSGEDVGTEPKYERVTWLDTCPVKTDDNWTLEPKDALDYNSLTQYYTIPGSLKIGFWDDFNDDRYSSVNWTRTRYSTSGYSIGTFNDRRCMITNPWSAINLESIAFSDRWNFAEQEHYIFAQMWDARQGGPTECGRINFRAHPRIALDCSVLHIYAFPGSPLPEFFAIWLSPLIRSYSAAELSKPAGWATYKVWVLNTSTSATESYAGETIPVSTGPAPRDSFRGFIRVYNAHSAYPYYNGWDNFRVIGTEGNYESFEFMPTGGSVDWGYIYFTVTNTKENTEYATVKLEMNGTTIDPPSGRITLDNSSSFKYKALFQTGPGSGIIGPFETPVLEDVWITYLPKTKVLYYREVAAD